MLNFRECGAVCMVKVCGNECVVEGMSHLVSFLHFLSANWRRVVECVARDFRDVRARKDAVYLVCAWPQFLSPGNEGKEISAANFGRVFSATGPSKLNDLGAQPAHHFLHRWR